MNKSLDIKQLKSTGAKIYLDDVREVPEGFIGAKSVNETIGLIEWLESEGVVITLLDLDHDLGEYANDGGDGIKLLDYLVENGKFYHVNLHTFNWVARGNMQRMLDRFWPKEDY